MKISEMIENLKEFMDEHGDMDCYYAVDDEGNDFHEVYYSPTLMFSNGYDLWSQRDIEEDGEDIDDFEKVCIVN